MTQNRPKASRNDPKQAKTNLKEDLNQLKRNQNDPKLTKAIQKETYTESKLVKTVQNGPKQLKTSQNNGK